MKTKIGIVVPSHSNDIFKKFIEKWETFDSEKYDITLYLIEDCKNKHIVVPKHIKHEHYCWNDIDKDLKKKSWIIPRGGSAVRSYGYYKAYQDECEYILNLDHDCYPADDNKTITDLINNHMLAFQLAGEYSSFYNVGRQFYPEYFVWMRGSPFKYRQGRVSKISVGGWDNVPDLDAITQLIKQTPKLKVRRSIDVVPKYMGVTICGMNIMFHRDVVPIIYYLLQGKDWGIDRYDDIWSGLFIKKVLDKFDIPICINGYACIYHSRVSDPNKSLYSEGIGYGANETLWDRLMEFNIEGDTIIKAYRSLADQLPLDSLHNEDYTKKLKEAMKIWTTLF